MKIEFKTVDYVVVHTQDRRTFDAAFSQKSRMQFGGGHHQRLVTSIKTLAIEKVCEFIASILSGNIYDRSAGRESSLRFRVKLVR